MLTLLTQRGSRPLLWIASAEFCLMLIAGAAGLFVSWPGWDFLEYSPQILLFAVVAMACLYACGLYRRRHVWSYADTAVRLVVALLIAFGVLASIYYTVPELRIYRSATAASFALLFGLLLITRRILVLLLDKGLARRQILVLGVGDNAARLVEIEGSLRGRRFAFVGFIDIGNEPRQVDPSRILPFPDSLSHLMETLGADEIILAAGERRGSLPLRSLIDCRFEGILVTSYQVFCERELGHIDYDALRPDWFLSEGFRRGTWRKRIKRGLDVLGSLVLLLLTWPLILATSIAIKIESAGGILYRQERLGLRGQVFPLTKFRSMYTDAEPDGVPRWAAQDDRRVTAIGRIIRAIRVDELPQILNVLKGEMSLVGPRPERPFFADQIAQSLTFYDERHHVKPGITGWAQLNYPYGASLQDSRRKLEYDLFYIKYFSIILDILIILQTVRIILWREGAR